MSTDGHTFQVQISYLIFPPLASNHWAPLATTGSVSIGKDVRDGAIDPQGPDECVEIRNDDTRPIQMGGWTLRDEANRVFTFPSYIMQPEQVCRIYTSQDHSEWCSLNYGSGWAIRNNAGDCAYLRDSTRTLIDTYCY